MNTSPEHYRYFEVNGDRSLPNTPVQQIVDQRSVPASSTVPDAMVQVTISHSSVNYKDALAATGHPGVARTLPLVPGIDAVGTVSESKSPQWQVGDRVLISAEEFGTASDGGWRQIAWVPDTWLLPAPQNLTNLQICSLGTAGITAAWCVDALLKNQVDQIQKPIVVSGATGGVGSFAIEILSKRLSLEVVAVSGKTDQTDWLKSLGATRVISRDEFVDTTNRSLLSARWAGGVDTIGSTALNSMLRSTSDGGCVAACGLVGGPDLNMTVYPFILRGVILYGIDCTRYRQDQKSIMWNRLATDWFPDQLVNQAKVITLDDASQAVFSLLEGSNSGRYVLDLQNG